MNILCPTDFSEASRDAAREAIALAQATGGTVTLLHVYDVPAVLYLTGTYLSPQLLQDLAVDVQAALEEWRAELETPGVPLLTAKVQGAAWHEIVRHAEDHDFDLVVMATHGHGSFRRALLGSVTEKVLRHAPCGVMVTHEHAPTQPAVAEPAPGASP